jgi:hypothetical protein
MAGYLLITVLSSQRFNLGNHHQYGLGVTGGDEAGVVVIPRGRFPTSRAINRHAAIRR